MSRTVLILLAVVSYILNLRLSSCHNKHYRILSRSMKTLEKQLQLDIQYQMEGLMDDYLKEVNVTTKLTDAFYKRRVKMRVFILEYIAKQVKVATDGLHNALLDRYRIMQNMLSVYDQIHVTDMARQKDFETLKIYIQSAVDDGESSRLLPDLQPYNATKTPPAPKIIATGINDRDFYELDMRTGKLFHGPLQHERTRDLVCDTKSNRVVYGSQLGHRVVMMSAFLNGSGVKQLTTDSATRFAIDNDRGLIFYTSGDYGELRVVTTDGTNNTGLTSHNFPEPSAIAVNTKDRMVYFTKNSIDSYILQRPYDRRTISGVFPFGKFKYVQAMAYDNVGRLLYISDSDGDVFVASFITMKVSLLFNRLTEHCNQPSRLHFEDNKLYVLTEKQSTVRVFERNGTELEPYRLTPLIRDWMGICILKPN